jgi:hypothetical protein
MEESSICMSGIKAEMTDISSLSGYLVLLEHSWELSFTVLSTFN